MVDYTEYVDKTLGKKKAQLVLKNINVINVFSEEIYPADVAISDGIFVGIGSYHGETEIDMSGKFISPGFIDGHLHFESTLVQPFELVKNAVKWGTTTFIADPHEAANVSGCDGIDYILNSTENVPADVYIMLPSCVPATQFDDNGFTLGVSEMQSYLNNKRILGLGEVMDTDAVINADITMKEKLKLFADKIIDGHAPFLEDKKLSAYALAGIKTDHECVDYEYAMKEVRNGIHVLIREGSAAKNLSSIVSGIVKNNTDTSNFSFCTDDKHIEEIKEKGHISYNIKKAISLGIPPIKAIKMATINTAKCYGLKHLGAISVGYQASFVILNNIEEMDIHSVYYKGVDTDKFNYTGIDIKQNLLNTINTKPLREQDIQLRVCGDTSIIELINGEILTKHIKENLGEMIFSPSSEYNKIVVIERHMASGKVGVGIVKNFGIKKGAIATSVSHDSHNIIVIGDNDKDILKAVDEIKRTQGGYAISSDGEIISSLPLAIMGLMSNEGNEKVNAILKEMLKVAYSMGVNKNIEPFITLSFLALTVLPEIRITSRGVFDSRKNNFI